MLRTADVAVALVVGAWTVDVAVAAPAPGDAVSAVTRHLPGVARRVTVLLVRPVVAVLDAVTAHAPAASVTHALTVVTGVLALRAVAHPLRTVEFVRVVVAVVVTVAHPTTRHAPVVSALEIRRLARYRT